ncbi:MAG: ABC transporter substrate-binding protein [Chloroflexota bacterium]
MSNQRNLFLILMIIVILGAVVFFRGFGGSDSEGEESLVEQQPRPTFTPAQGEAADNAQSADQQTDAAPTPVATVVGGNVSVEVNPPETNPPVAEYVRGENEVVYAVAQDAGSLNPILSANSTSINIAEKIFPVLIGLDANTGMLIPSELAETWGIADDGRTYTFTLRDDILWSDGTPVTAQDVKFTYDAILDEAVQSPFRLSMQQIESVEAVSDTELTVSLVSPNCSALMALRRPLLPSHLYADDFSDLRTNSQSEMPTIGAGPFLFGERVRGQRVSLVPNDSYGGGTPSIEQWTYLVVPDMDERQQMMVEGKIDLVSLDTDEIALLDDVAGTTMYRYASDGYHFISLNLGDPSNPQPGRDAGDLLAQDPHPILGDVNVRLALAHAIDYDQIINEVYEGEGYRLGSYISPIVEWAFDDSIEPYAYDIELASQYLADAGWADSDDDGILDKDGVPLQLSLTTNEDNNRRVQAGELLEEQFAVIGVDAQFEAQPFEMVTGHLLGQTYDMIIIGWENLGPDPATSTFWQSDADVPNQGLNMTSFQSEEVDKLVERAMILPGCEPSDRAGEYSEVQRIIHEEVPYIFLSGSLDAWVYADRWANVDPAPWTFDHNLQGWQLAE